MNFFQRIILLLGAIFLVSFVWRSPIQKAIVRAIAIVGATLFICFAFSGLE
jgi:hypothetical protein